MKGAPSQEGSHAVGAAVGRRVVGVTAGGGLHRMALLPEGAPLGWWREPDLFLVGMKTDRIRTDITDIIFVFLFLVEFRFKYR